MARRARRAPATKPGKKPASIATPGKALHWLDAGTAAPTAEEDVVGEGIVVAMLGTLDGFVGAAVDVVEDPVEVEDAEEEEGVICLFIAHMLFWHA